VPIMIDGRVIGIIDSEHPQRGFFTQEHLSVLVSIASLAANKLIRARAEAQLQRLNEDLEQRVVARTAELADANTRLRGEVAARKSAQAELGIALEAEKELNQLKSSFVSMVSHEFRTPLEVILSSSNILDRYLDRLSHEKRHTQLRAIRKSVHRMNDLIEDVLLLGKFDAGGLACCPTPLDLAGFCRRVVNEIESATGRDGAIRFVSDDFNGEAVGDEGLLHHIVINLLSNAVKYSPPGKPVEFTVTRHQSGAELVIRDYGCGVPAADQQRLFTAFYRGSNVGQAPGSGLGLVIVKRCVDLHGGTIRYESVEGRGTTFTTVLPLFDNTRVWRRRAEDVQRAAADKDV
jgi:signal transduction histidine kinase